jgi:aspartate racemase
MKTIGILGGMSWESSLEYYRLINQLTKQKLGGLHSAKSVMVSVDFDPIEALMSQGYWDQLADYLVEAAIQVEKAGADLLLIATNTMHKLYSQISQSVSIPILHIADATAESIINAGLKKVGLLGTKYTMEQDFYKVRLEEKFGLEVLIPGEFDRMTVDKIIFEELVLGQINPKSKAEYLRIMEDLVGEGAQGIILGCTEIMLLVQAQDASVPVFDTTYLHAEMSVKIALGERTMI